MKKPLLYLLILVVAVLGSSCSQSSEGTFEVGKNTFLLNGKPFVVKAAEIHYPRIPKEYWEHRIKMCKALGMNTICLYVFWNFHEPEEGRYDFAGQKDIAAFCRLAQENGMYVIVRPGPYVCAEWEMEQASYRIFFVRQHFSVFPAEQPIRWKDKCYFR
jgi:beta-galactosidase